MASAARTIAVVSIGLFLDGNVLSPRLVGASGIASGWLMFALFASAPVRLRGMIVAVPVAAAMGVMLRFLARRYRPATISAAGRPAVERG